jgi:hypothetical protein
VAQHNIELVGEGSKRVRQKLRNIASMMGFYWRKSPPFSTKRSPQNIQICACGKALTFHHRLGRQQERQSGQARRPYHSTEQSGKVQAERLGRLSAARIEVPEHMGEGSYCLRHSRSTGQLCRCPTANPHTASVKQDFQCYAEY